MKIRQSVSGNILTTKVGKNTYEQELIKKPRHKSIVPGVYYETFTISSSRYLSVMHASSGACIKSFMSGPTKQIKQIIKHLDTIIVFGRWDCSIEEVKTDRNQYVQSMLFVEYSISAGSYVIDPHFLKQKDSLMKSIEYKANAFDCLAL